LTSNKLEFKVCCIGNELYGCTDSYLNDEQNKNLERRVTARTGGRGMNYEFTFPENIIKDQICGRAKSKSLGMSLKCDKGKDTINFEFQSNLVEYFMLGLALNHTCFVDDAIVKEKVKEKKTTKVEGEAKRLSEVEVEDNESEFKYIQYKV
jgi:hypothetical protein